MKFWSETKRISHFGRMRIWQEENMKTSMVWRYELLWITSRYDPTEGFCEYDNGSFGSITIHILFKKYTILLMYVLSFNILYFQNVPRSISLTSFRNKPQNWCIACICCSNPCSVHMGVPSCLAHIHFPRVWYHHFHISIFPLLLTCLH